MPRQNRLPPLDYLLAFESAAKYESFAKAAKERNISESAISRKVKLLEDFFGLKLFIRGHRSISLTSKGHYVLNRFSPLLEGVREAVEEILTDQQAQTVTLAATNSVASLWLMPRLRLFHKKFNAVKIDLVSSDIDAECLDERMDLVILRGDGHWLGYQSQLLFGEKIFPVCSPDFLNENPQIMHLSNLIQSPLIGVSSTHSEWMNWHLWLQHFADADADVFPEQSALFNTYPLSIQAAVDGLGVALGWQGLVEPFLEQGQLVKPLSEAVQTFSLETKFGYYLLRKENYPATPQSKIVEQWLSES